MRAIIYSLTMMENESDEQSCYDSETSGVSEKIVKQKKLRKKPNIPITTKATPKKRKLVANQGKYKFYLNVMLN